MTGFTSSVSKKAVALNVYTPGTPASRKGFNSTQGGHAVHFRLRKNIIVRNGALCSNRRRILFLKIIFWKQMAIYPVTGFTSSVSKKALALNVYTPGTPAKSKPTARGSIQINVAKRCGFGFVKPIVVSRGVLRSNKWHIPFLENTFIETGHLPRDGVHVLGFEAGGRVERVHPRHPCVRGWEEGTTCNVFRGFT